MDASKREKVHMQAALSCLEDLTNDFVQVCSSVFFYFFLFFSLVILV